MFVLCRAQLAEIMQKVQNLKDKYDKSINAKAELEAELDDLNVRFLSFYLGMTLLFSSA